MSFRAKLLLAGMLALVITAASVTLTNALIFKAELLRQTAEKP